MEEKIIPLEISSDQPIHSLKDDLLGRGNFAIAVANAIRNWNEDQSLIVGLYGRWGTGKTSIKNMVVSLLENAENSPTIVHFNPWNWSGEDRLMSTFFEEIAVVLSQDADTQIAKNISVAWDKYAARLQLGGTALSHLKTAAEVLGLPLVGPILGAVAKSTIAAADVTKKASEAGNASEQESLIELKTLLCKALTITDKPIVVVIDDIDRLTSEEIRLLFRLVRVNADFPKIIYLMLFDRKVVEGALEEVSPGSGRNYLEKIVQVGFDVPRASQSCIDRVLFDGLERILNNAGANEFVDMDRWQNLYPEAIRPFFTSIRDVRRFLSAFSFTIGLFFREKELDVNFVDLLSLEVLRIFEPTVYERIGKASEWIAPSPLAQIGQPIREMLKPNLDSLLYDLSDDRKNAVEQLLAALFPSVDFALGGLRHEGVRLQWERGLRVCHDAMFDRYFAFDVPDDEISIAQIRRLLSGLTRKEVCAELQRNHAEGKLKALIQRLEAYNDSLPPEHVQPMVTAFFDAGDVIPRDYEGVFGSSADMLAFRFLHFNTMQISDHNKRSALILSCLHATGGFWLPVLFVATEEPRDSEEEPIWDRCVFTEEGMNEARQLALERIRSVNLLEIEPAKACYCLWRWKDWAGIDEPKSWLGNTIKKQIGALHVLAMLVRKVRSSRGGAAHTYFEFNLTEVSEFVLPETLLASLPDPANTSLDQKLQDDYLEQLKALEDAIKADKESAQVK